MTESNVDIKDKVTLEQISEPDRTEIVPGLIFEDKIRIKTQRRLEKQFNLPMSRIFPGSILKKAPIDPENPEAPVQMIVAEEWPGVNFEFLDNLIPLMTILGKQADDTVTQEKVEELFDNPKISINQAAQNLGDYFMRAREKAARVNGQTKNA